MASGSARALLIVPAGLSLVAGLFGALSLAGLPSPFDPGRLDDIHGIVLVLGFLGTLVALERAVALRHPAGFAAPALLGASGIASFLSGIDLQLAKIGFVLGTLALTGVLVALWRRRYDTAVLIEVLAAGLGVGAALLWLTIDIAGFIPWLAGFIVLTIAAERVELARVAMSEAVARLILVVAMGIALTLVASLAWPDHGTRAFGIGLLLLVAVLVRHDVARRTVRSSGLPRFSAVAILTGYVWLAVAASVWAIGGVATTSAPYDVTIHAVFLGFAISMVMAHAPIILPAVLRRPLPYGRASWIPFVTLQLGLVVRLAVGDVLAVEGLAWKIGAALTIAALVLFVVVSATMSLRATVTDRPAEAVAA